MKVLNDASKRNKKLTFKNNTPFRSCISKINDTFIDSEEGLDIVVPIYNLLEYSENYSMRLESLRNYYRDEINDSANENNDVDSYRIKKNKIATSHSFEYKTKTIERTPKNNNVLDTEVFVPLEYSSNFWRSHDVLLSNCEIELDLSLSRYCVVSEISRATAWLKICL